MTKTTNRINISITDPEALEIIDKAAEDKGVSRSSYLIEVGLKQAKEDLQIKKALPTCEVCGKRVQGEDIWPWKKAKQYGVGNVCCPTCADSINELPDDVVMAALKARAAK